MKNFDNWAYIKTCLLYLPYLNLFLLLFEIIYYTLLASICSKWDLLVIIFLYYKMINLDNITNKNNKKHNEKWPYIPDHPYRILIIVGSGSGKTNTLLNLINE